MAEIINKLVKAEKDLILAHGKEPTLEQITEELNKTSNLNLTTQRVSEIKKLNVDLISLDKPISTNENANLTDFVPDYDSVSPQDVAIKHHQSQVLSDFLKASLTPDELTIISMYYGLGNFESEHSVEQIVSEQLLKRGNLLIQNKNINAIIQKMLDSPKSEEFKRDKEKIEEWVDSVISQSKRKLKKLAKVNKFKSAFGFQSES